MWGLILLYYKKLSQNKTNKPSKPNNKKKNKQNSRCAKIKSKVLYKIETKKKQKNAREKIKMKQKRSLKAKYENHTQHIARWFTFTVRLMRVCLSACLCVYLNVI